MIGRAASYQLLAKPKAKAKPKPQRTQRSIAATKIKTHHGDTEPLRKHGENQLHRGGAETLRNQRQKVTEKSKQRSRSTI